MIAPLDAAARFQLVIAYIAMGQREWARPELARLVGESPSTAIYHYWLGRIDYDAGRYAEAIVHLQAAAARDASFPRTFDNLGLCYEALNDIDTALAQFREGVRLNRLTAEPSAWPPLNLAAALTRRGEHGEAERLAREAIGFDPRFARAHYQLGIILEATARQADAAAALREAAAADPAYPEPLYALARILRRQGRIADADAALAEFLARRAAAATPRTAAAEAW